PYEQYGRDRDQAGGDRRPANRGRRLQHTGGRVRACQLIGSASQPGQQGGLDLTEGTRDAAPYAYEHHDDEALPATGHRGGSQAQHQSPRHDGGDQQPLTPYTVGPARDQRHQERPGSALSSPSTATSPAPPASNAYTDAAVNAARSPA